MPGVGMGCTHFLSPSLWFLCLIVETNQIHLDMYDISKKLTYLLQIQHCSYCVCMLQLQPEKSENGIQLMWFTLLILRLPSPSLSPKRFFSNRAFITSLTATRETKFNFVITELSRSILPKRSMLTKSLLFRIMFGCTLTLFRVPIISLKQ